MSTNTLHIAVVAHLIDNKVKSEEDRPWVETFVKNLRIRLAQLTGKNVSMDVIFPQELVGGAQESRSKNYQYVLPVFSKWFIQSEDCIRVTKDILEKQTSERSKCIGLIKKHIDINTLPLAIQYDQLLNFWIWDDDTEKYLSFSPEDTKTTKFFWAKLDDCANEIFSHWSKNFRSKSRSKSKTAPKGLTVFLAECSQDISAYRDVLKRDFLDKGIRVLPETKLPNQLSELNAELTKLIEESDFSIHILGSEYGEIPEGSNRSVVEIQNDIAEEVLSVNQKPRLMWVPEGLVTQDERQRILIDDSQSSMENVGSAEVVVGVIEVFKGVIQQQVSRLEFERSKLDQEQSRKEDFSKLYIVCDFTDKPEIEKLRLELKTQKCDVLLSAFEEGETALRNAHMENLKECDAVLFYYNRANQKWLTTRILETKRVKAYGRKKEMFQAAIGVGKQRKKELKTLPIKSLPVLDVTKGTVSEDIISWIQQWNNIS